MELSEHTYPNTDLIALSKTEFRDQDLFTRPCVVFGGSGFLGRELVKRIWQLQNHPPHWGGTVCVASRDEAKHSSLKETLSAEIGEGFKLKTKVCDIRDRRAVRKVLREVQPGVVIIASAMKQIDACQAAPEECIKTNIGGLVNILEEVEDLECVERVVFVSSDKALDPANVYGATKCLGEKLTLSKNSLRGRTRFQVVRYGNVFGSTGSIFPRIQEWLQKKTPLLLTSPSMTRYHMTSAQAVDTIFTSLVLPLPGVFIPALRAHAVADLFDLFQDPEVGIKEIGIRPGEKLHESLLSARETGFCRVVMEGTRTNPGVAWLCDPGLTLKGFLVNEQIPPHTRQGWVMNSRDDCISKEDLRTWLQTNGWLR